MPCSRIETACSALQNRDNELAVPFKIDREREIIRLQCLAKSIGRLGGGGRAGRLGAVGSEGAERRPRDDAPLLCASGTAVLICSSLRAFWMTTGRGERQRDWSINRIRLQSCSRMPD